MQVEMLGFYPAFSALWDHVRGQCFSTKAVPKYLLCSKGSHDKHQAKLEPTVNLLLSLLWDQSLQ
jgi:hypothetical protein